jgi:hypothetical protein
MDQGAYSQHFIFFVTYESAQKARMLHNIKPERLASDMNKPNKLECISYEEMKFSEYGPRFFLIFYQKFGAYQ